MMCADGLAHSKGLRLVLLFGSLAIGRTHRDSDIDLAFLFDRDVDMVALTARVIELLLQTMWMWWNLERQAPCSGFP